MRYFETSSSPRVRPSHLLLMIYRYLSGIYQTGDVSALNYVKGFLDGSGNRSAGRQILTVSGHGIGEAEMWLSRRMPDANIDTVSFRLIDTQLLQFLRATNADDVHTLFARFAGLVERHQQLSAWVNHGGLVPYWCRQAESLSRCFDSGRVHVFSNSPLAIPESRTYDLIYVSHGSRYLTVEALNKLRSHLKPGGHLAVLTPARSNDENNMPETERRFADLEIVRSAEADFSRRLEERGYVLRSMQLPALDIDSMARLCERIHFSVLAPADDVLIGQLILRSLGEHISDRSRLEVLNETAGRYRGLQVPVNEELELYFIGAEPCKPAGSSVSSRKPVLSRRTPLTTR